MKNIFHIYKLKNNKRRILFQEDNRQSWITLDLNNSKEYCLFQSYKRQLNS